ncbi:MAG: phenylalanine--tRNA ligase subunit alpha, partial [Erysipelotrichaceae bacterium]
MEQNWESLKQQFTETIESAADLNSIEAIRIDLLGKKGKIAALMANMATISKEEKKNYGMAVNSLKQHTEKLLAEKIEQLKEKDMLEKIQQEKIDITLPATRIKYGTKHPLTIVREEIEDIFMSMGYS